VQRRILSPLEKSPETAARKLLRLYRAVKRDTLERALARSCG
jgi:hypothetical protein